MLRLGEAIERTGGIPEAKLAETAALRRAVRRRCAPARRRAARGARDEPRPPGGQRRRSSSRGSPRLRECPVRLLSAQEEGRLAFLGALSATRGGARRLLAVCDVGGGSAQVAVGTRREGVAWVRSIDIGSMRLTSRMLDDDPPGDAAVARARTEVERHARGVPASRTRDRARRRRQRPRAPRHRRAATSAPTSSTRSPGSSPAPRRARSPSSTASRPTASGRSPPAR